MCSLGAQAGLFSAVTSAFVINVQPQLQPDMGGETAALLRVLIYKIDNTTFGDDTPTLPQWIGPSHGIVQVQATLYASLAASLLSAFLAMLGKQWLNRYASTDVRGTTIERSQNRQRKLDGIVAWYFDHVMEALQLMLQIALLLLGCALSRYLWEINNVVASVVIGATSFLLAFYASIIIAGAASESCPYQTPGANILRYSLVFVSSWRSIVSVKKWTPFKRPWYSKRKISAAAAVKGAYSYGRTMLRSLVTSIGMVYNRAMGTSHQARLSDQAIALDLQCVSWMLQTSLDGTVRLSALKYLGTMTALVNLNPAIVADCFNVFVRCINVSNEKVVIMHESEQLATVSAMCFLRAFRHLLDADPTSDILKDVRQQYHQLFSSTPYSWDLPTCYMMAKIKKLVYPTQNVPVVQPFDYASFTQEHIPVARGMAEGALVAYEQTQRGKVPRWILRFALHSLSLDPLPPTPVIADCLSIIAVDLGCDVMDTGFTTSDERCVHI